MYKLLEIEREAFAEWLKEHPETPFTPCHGDECPLAVYLSYRDQRNYCIAITTAHTEGQMYDEWLNMLVGGLWYDRAEYRNLVAGHITGKARIDPAQWRGWPRLVCDNQGWRYEGVW